MQVRGTLAPTIRKFGPLWPTIGAMPKINKRTLTQGSRKGQPVYIIKIKAHGTQRTVRFDTLDDAQKFNVDVENRGGSWAYDNLLREEAMLDAQEVGAPVNPDEQTLDEWAEFVLTYLHDVSKAQLNNVRRDYERCWLPELGHMRLSQIQRIHVIEARNKLTGTEKTKMNKWSALTTIMEYAVREQMIASSPTEGVTIKVYAIDEEVDDEARGHRYLTDDEIAQMLHDTPEHYRSLITTLAGTGLRWGEATALKVGDVDLKKRTIRVSKAWKQNPEAEDGKRWYLGKPKTKRSKRAISIGPTVVMALKPLVETRKRTDFVFTSKKNNDWIRGNAFRDSIWHKYCTQNIESPKPRIHDLRHTHASALIAAGKDLLVVRDRLGHESIMTTADVYGHLQDGADAEAADAAEAIFKGKATVTELPRKNAG